ncbi:MAG: DUF3473 domain-containing protein [Deltaproteobacteria bacterium]|nr:DUF3473 domain-containing protein [Deltaproteobacteria bacterium]
MLNAMTIDVEDYFHVSNFEDCIPRGEWDFMPLRVEESTRKTLEVLSVYGVRATFFVLGWVAERLSHLIREIRAAGHEVASHGHDHRLAFDMTPEEFRADIRRSKAAIEDAIGERVYGYRATSYSFLRKNLWCLKVLAEEGFLYDSSIFPVYHDRYGIPEWDRFPSMVSEGGYTICEVPPSTIRLFGHNIPMAGGGYLRLLPVWFLERGIRSINTAEGMPAVVYIHPWEFDAEQPRIRTPFLRGFRHYNNIRNTEKKISHLLKNFSFGPVCEAIDIKGMAR